MSVHRLSSRHYWFSDMCHLSVFTGNVFSPIVQWSLMMRWHVSVMCLHWECLFTDCPVVNDDSLTCQSCIHIGVSVHWFSSPQWWFTDMCQSCIHIGSVCSLIVQSSVMIHWHVSVVCLHWEWQVRQLSSRQWWFTDICPSCVYIGNGKFTDCPVVIYDLVTCVSHVSKLGMLFTDSPVVIDNSVTCVSHVSLH